MLISSFECLPTFCLFWSCWLPCGIYSLRTLTLPLDGIKWRSSLLNMEFLNHKDASIVKSLTAAIKTSSIGLDLTGLSKVVGSKGGSKCRQIMNA